jgi:hypothetical protein
MSRSFHSTWRKLISENHYEFSDDNLKNERIKQIRKRLSDKHDTKKAVIIERKSKSLAIEVPDVINSSTLDIQFKDENQYIHFPVTRQDLLSE